MNSKSRKLTSWTVTIALLALMAGCFPTQPSQETSQSTSTSSPSPSNNSSPETPLKPSVPLLPKFTYGIKQVVPITDKNLNLQFTVNGIREHKGKGVIKPNQGNKWIAIDTTTVNKGHKPKTLSVASFELIDSENNPYEVALLAGALDDIKSPTGQIDPGDERRGEVAFEVPEKAKGLKLLFKPHSDCKASASKRKASAKLQCEPIVVKLD
jgi:hypothetical protein